MTERTLFLMHKPDPKPVPVTVTHWRNPHINVWLTVDPGPLGYRNLSQAMSAWNYPSVGGIRVIAAGQTVNILRKPN